MSDMDKTFRMKQYDPETHVVVSKEFISRILKHANLSDAAIKAELIRMESGLF